MGTRKFGLVATFLLALTLHSAARIEPSVQECTTVKPGPDWVCAFGGWWPPGMTIPGAPPPPPAPPPDSSCTTPDPFVSLGGGTCCEGGWRPPGMACPSTSPPEPPTEPPSEPAACTTVQPAPDWTCFKGGWLPPGITGSCLIVFLEPMAGGDVITSVNVPVEGGAFRVWTLADPPFSCPWSAFPEVDWITVTSPEFPTFAHGDGVVNFTVQANTTGVERVGTIRVGEKILTVIQSAE